MDGLRFHVDDDHHSRSNLHHLVTIHLVILVLGSPPLFFGGGGMLVVEGQNIHHLIRLSFPIAPPMTVYLVPLTAYLTHHF
jgi:hypothetical protein